MKIYIKAFIFVLAGSLLLMIPAFYNGYPIVYSDTGTYIGTGFDFYNPPDRPPTYGLFVWFASLKGVSLWLVVFIQSFILSGLIFFVIKQVIDKGYQWKGLVILLFLSFFTGIAWVSSQIMADIATPIALLTLALILFGRTSKIITILLYILFYITASMHGSHLIFFSLLIIIIFILNKWLLPRALYPKRLIRLAVVFFLLMGTIPIISYSYSKSSHIFFMGAMDEQGILKQYLDEYCGQKHYFLCAYKDSLPGNCCDFVWNPNSPLNRSHDWEGNTKTEYKEIINATLTTPKYIWLHIQKSIQFTYTQLSHFQSGDSYIPLLEGSSPYMQINSHFPRELNKYMNSKQSKNEHGFIDPWNFIIYKVMLLALLILAILVFFKKKILGQPYLSILFLLLLGLLLNDWSCSTFSCIAQRFGIRVAWFIPFFASLGLIRFLDLRKKSA